MNFTEELIKKEGRIVAISSFSRKKIYHPACWDEYGRQIWQNTHIRLTMGDLIYKVRKGRKCAFCGKPFDVR